MASTSASSRHARPRTGICLVRRARARRGVLRRALGHERVAFPNELATLLAHRHDDLAALAEGVGNGAGVGDCNGARMAAAVANAEVELGADTPDRAVDDHAGELVGLP